MAKALHQPLDIKRDQRLVLAMMRTRLGELGGDVGIGAVHEVFGDLAVRSRPRIAGRVLAAAKPPVISQRRKTRRSGATERGEATIGVELPRRRAASARGLMSIACQIRQKRA